eukprot:2197187-Rhodomonas_salina.3
MAAQMCRAMLAAVAMLSMVSSAAAVEVCKVVDLQLVTQTGEFFLAGKIKNGARCGASACPDLIQTAVAAVDVAAA